MTDTAGRLLDAVLPHVPFDGWSDAALRAAVADCGLDPALARALFPRGGVDLALAWHRRGDAAMVETLATRDLSALKFRDRVALAVRLRLDGLDVDTVRRASALLALPHNAPEAARAVWGTADAIWTALGDTSTDGNWYSKRAILSGVYSAVVLYWLGDTSEGKAETWAFLDRRIEDVMRFESAKAKVRASPVLNPLLGWPLRLMERVKAPVGSR